MNTLLGYSYKNGGKVPSSYQNGGNVSPTLAALLRKREKYNTKKAYEEAMAEEVEKRKSASDWGGFGSLAGSLLLPALAGISGGALLPVLAGLGAYGGKKIGASSGYSGGLDVAGLVRSPESEDYSDTMEEKDLIYGKDAFEDLESSSRDYSRAGIDQDALVSGLTSALMAGFGGDDSIYAKAGSTDLLKKGSLGRIADLFKKQAMPGVEDVMSAPEADFIIGAEQGLYGDIAPYKASLGLNRTRTNPMAAGLSMRKPSQVTFNPAGSQPVGLLDYTNPYK